MRKLGIVLFLFLFLAGSLLSLEDTNEDWLRQFSDVRRVQMEQEKAAAIQLANRLGFPIRLEAEDGTLMEVQRIMNGLPVYYTTNNSNASLTTRTNSIRPGGSLGLNYSGALHSEAGVWDGGGVRYTHQEFGVRVTQIDTPSSYHYHATHVAGTMVAAGIQANARGMAYQGTLSAYDWDLDESEMALAAADGMEISNHSYGVVCGWYQYGDWYWYGDTSISQDEDYKFGFYGADTQAWDEIAWNAPFYLICKSAGNDRNDEGPAPGTEHYVMGQYGWVTSTYDHGPDGDGPNGDWDTVSLKGTAKNILTVGSVNDVTSHPGTINSTSFSGWGPTDDGRIKPDIVGNGENLYSTDSGNDYDYRSISGTSMSSPNVSGSLILLQEYWYDQTGSPMKAATLKALACHTAEDAGNPGPDYSFGWGLLNIEAAARAIEDELDETGEHIIQSSITQGQILNFNVSVGSSADELRATICWTDLPGTPPAASLDPSTPMLVHDLDVEIIGPNRATYDAWVLDPSNPGNNATTGDNDLDNIEQVLVDSPAAGSYTVRVTTEGSITGSQAFSLIITGNQATTDAMSVLSSTTVQVTRDTEQGATQVPVVCLEVLTTGTTSPLTMTQINFATTGTTSVSDIQNARVWCTGGNPTFSASNQYGSTIATPSGGMVFTDSQALLTGTNHFWLTYDIDSNATSEHLVDAVCSQFIAGSTITPSITAPTGSRRIHNVHYGGGSSAEDGYYYANSTANASGAASQPVFDWIADYTESAHRIGIAAWTGNMDDGYYLNDLGFAFPFCGNVYDQVYISTNGIVRFGSAPIWPSGGAGSDDTIPASDGESNYIAGCYMDWDTTLGRVYRGGDDDRFVITWEDIDSYDDNSVSMTFQIVLYPTGNIKIQFDQSECVNYDPAVFYDAVIGMENSNGSAGIGYRVDNAGGPIFGSDLAVTFGTNVQGLDYSPGASGTENVVISTTGDTSPHQFVDSGLELQFTGAGNSAPTTLSVTLNQVDPGGDISGLANVENIADAQYWIISSSGGSAIGTYDLTLDLSGIPNISNYFTLRLLKRPDGASAWVDEGVPDAGSTPPVMTWTGLTSFSEVTVGGGADNPLPVELTAFTATPGANNSALLEWSVQSETGILGYHVFRAESEEIFQALPLTAMAIPALNLPESHSYNFEDSEVVQEITYHYWLQVLELDGSVGFHGPIAFTAGQEPGDGQAPDLPLVTELLPNFPNPFNPETTIRFSLAEQDDVRIAIFNIRGQQAAGFRLVGLDPGYHSVVWNGRMPDGNAAGSGVYLIRMETSGTTATRRAILMK